jgi:hypothetical protein
MPPVRINAAYVDYLRFRYSDLLDSFPPGSFCWRFTMCREAARDFPVFRARGMSLMTYQYNLAVDHGQYSRPALADCWNGSDIRPDKPTTEPNGIPEGEDDIGVSIDKCRTCRLLQVGVRNHLECRVGRIDEVLGVRLPEIVVRDESRLTIDHQTSVGRKNRSPRKHARHPMHNKLCLDARQRWSASGPAGEVLPQPGDVLLAELVDGE